MALSHELISQFAKIVKDNKKRGMESTVYGVIVADGNGNKYVKLDGSDQLTPLSDDERPSADSTLVGAKSGERVSVLIKDHTATVTGNVSSPAVRTGDFNDLNDQVTNIKSFDIVIAERVQANEGYIQQLRTDKAEIGDLTAATARITELETKKASIEELNAAKAEITDLVATKIDVDVADAKYATIENLKTANADIDDLQAKNVTVENTLTAHGAKIDNLDVAIFDAETGNIKFANIDFSNIGKAAIEQLFTKTGIIDNLVVDDTHITGELVGVTIKGDLIEAGTLVADKLVIQGEDGLYYKLNLEAGTFTESEVVPTDSIHGSVIAAKSITAEKVNVSDLVAFGATIGGFNITEDSIYSGVKETVDNITRGIHLNSDGQMSIGDSNNYIKFYEDENDKYKLEISADSIKFSMGNSSKTMIDLMNDDERLSEDIKYLANKTEYINIGKDDNDKPYIELGEGDSGFKLKITNEQIQFIDGSEVPAYISNQKLMIEKAEVHNELRFGSFVWKERDNGNMGLIWEEATS